MLQSRSALCSALPSDSPATGDTDRRGRPAFRAAPTRPPRPSSGHAAALGVAVLGLLAGGPVQAEAALEPEAIAWTWIARDVWLDGKPAPHVRVLASEDPERLALLGSGDAEALVLEEDGRLRRIGRDSFTPGEPPSFSGPDPGPIPEGAPDEGRWSEIPGGGLYGSTPEHSFLVLPHEGPAGPITPEELWDLAPLWRDLGEAWGENLATPDGAADADGVRRLAAVADPTELEIYFGSWCGDSRRSVPPLLVALERAANPQIDVRLVAISRGFEEPLDGAQEQRITNVPTVVVRRAGREIGRFVETPRSESVVTDLAAILAGSPPPAPERFTSSDRLLARGRYAVSGPTEETLATEEWSLFTTEAGDRRLFVRITPGSAVGSGVSGPVGTTTIWHRLEGAEGATAFVEVTRESSAETTRTRFSRRANGVWSGLTRGDASGIVEQRQHPPGNTVVTGPGAASRALALAAESPEGPLPLLTLPATGGGFAGRLETIRVERFDAGPLEIGGAVRPALGLRLHGGETGPVELHLDAELGILLLANGPGATRVRLEELEITAEDAAATGSGSPPEAAP